MKKKLYRSEKYKMICGVCGGIAEFFNCDPTLIRLSAVILAMFKGAGILLYILAAIIIPSANMRGGEDFSDDDVNKMKDAKVDENQSSDSPRSDDEFNSYFKKGKK